MPIATENEFFDWADARGIQLTGDTQAALFVAENDFLNVRYTFKDDVTNDQKKPALFQAAYQHLQGRLFVDLSTQEAGGIVDSISQQVGSLSQSKTFKSGSARTDTYSLEQIEALLKGLIVGGGGLGEVRRW